MKNKDILDAMDDEGVLNNQALKYKPDIIIKNKSKERKITELTIRDSNTQNLVMKGTFGLNGSGSVENRSTISGIDMPKGQYVLNLEDRDISNKVKIPLEEKRVQTGKDGLKGSRTLSIILNEQGATVEYITTE